MTDPGHLGAQLRIELLVPCHETLSSVASELELLRDDFPELSAMAELVDALTRSLLLYLAAADGPLEESEAQFLAALYDQERDWNALAADQGDEAEVRRRLAEAMSVLIYADAWLGHNARDDDSVEVSGYVLQVLELLGREMAAIDGHSSERELDRLASILDKIRYGIKAAGFGRAIDFDESRIDELDRVRARSAIRDFLDVVDAKD